MGVVRDASVNLSDASGDPERLNAGRITASGFATLGTEPVLCHTAGGELEQIQFLLGHVSVETTERYLGCKQRLRNAVNDKIGLEP